MSESSLLPSAPSENISILSTIHGVVNQLHLHSNSLKPIVSSSRSALSTTVKRLDTVRSTIKALHALLQRASEHTLKKGKETKTRAHLIQLDVIITLFTACTMTLSYIDETIQRQQLRQQQQQQQQSRGIKDSPWKSDAADLIATSIARDLNRLDTLEVFFAKLNIILQTSDDSEATRQYNEVEAFVTDMLQSDIIITARIAHIKDVFNTLIDHQNQGSASKPTPLMSLTPPLPPTLPVSTTVSPNSLPPSYSVPHATDEPPPGYTTTALDGGPNEDGSVTVKFKSWSVFSDFTLGDIPDLKLVPVALQRSEIRCADLYDTDTDRHASSRGLFRYQANTPRESRHVSKEDRGISTQFHESGMPLWKGPQFPS